MIEKFEPRNDVAELKTFKDLVTLAETTYKDDIAYKWKKDLKTKPPVYETRTYGEFAQNIKELGAGLLDLNLKTPRVAIIGNNSYTWAISYLAITTAGMIVVPLDKSLPENEIEALIQRSEVEAIIFDSKYETQIIKIKHEKTNNLKFLIETSEPKESSEIISFDDILKNGKKLLKNGDKTYENVKIDPEVMSIMLFTSGTTNLPKAVMLSQRNICSDLNAVIKTIPFKRQDRLLSFLPMHHTFECTVTYLYSIYAGATVCFCDGLKHIGENLKEYKITVFITVPLVLETMYKKIQKSIEDSGKSKLIGAMSKVSNMLLKHNIDLRKKIFKQIQEAFGGELRMAIYGSAPMNRATIEGLNTLGIQQFQGYGLTETSPVVAVETPENHRVGSIGKAITTAQIKIADPDKDGVGEVIIKGPMVMMGYYQNEKATKEALKDGWLYTGDYGYIDSDGFIYITGRKKDLIVLRNGKNVYPQEVEFIINKLSYVKESLVYSRDRSTTDTLLCAKIVYDPEIIEQLLGKRTKEEYKKLVWNKIKEINQSLPTYKHIKEIELTTEALDKTTTQKVKRYQEISKIKAEEAKLKNDSKK